MSILILNLFLKEELSRMLWDFAKDKSKCQHLCGVPYTALPVATLISVNAKIPMLIRYLNFIYLQLFWPWRPI